MKLCPPQNLPRGAENLVDLTAICPGILLDMPYATSHNFMGFTIYSHAACFLHRDVAKALYQVQAELQKQALALKIYDGYRPLHVQQLMWDAIQDERFISNPKVNGGRHTRGTAVDLTLIDSQGCELEMPSLFDEFNEKASATYMGGAPAALKNRALLTTLMQKHGFTQIPSEWWHFDFNGWQDDARYPVLDVSLEDLLKFKRTKK